MKTALVTGAARGIGLATTKPFLEEGWHVAMVDRDGPALDEAAEGLPNVLQLIYDVSDPEQVREMTAQTEAAFDGLDAVVNNAGVAEFGPMAECDFAKWRRVMETNLDGVFQASQATVPMLSRKDGAIVNIASISGLRASTLRVAYGTSKANAHEQGPASRLRITRQGT